MSMLTLSQVIVIAYFLAINVYGFILINFQRKAELQTITKKEEEFTQLQIDDLPYLKETKKQKNTKQNKTQISNTKIFISGVLGGALGVYIAMFIYKHKLSNFFFMVVIPVFIAVNVYTLVTGFINNFWIFAQNPI